jgi:hypothetical protein
VIQVDFEQGDNEMKKLFTTRSTVRAALAVAALAATALPLAAAQRPSVVGFVDTSTLVRDMVKQQVTIGGQSLPKVVVPARYCAGLVTNGSRSVKLPDIRWGARTTTPVAVPHPIALTLAWPGQEKRGETLPDGMSGGTERVFTFLRPGLRLARVTLLAVGAGPTQTVFGGGSARNPRPTAPPGGNLAGATDGTSNTVMVGEFARPTPTPTPRALSSVRDGTSNTVMVGETNSPGPTVCVSDVFVADPPVEVLVNVSGAPGQSPVSRAGTF